MPHCCNHSALLILFYHTRSRNLPFESWCGGVPADFLQKVDWYQKGDYVFLSLEWAAIFSIKASFLCFFKQLINRLNGIIVYWRVVVVTTAGVFVVCVAAEFIACPRLGLAACKYSLEAAALWNAESMVLIVSCSIRMAFALSYVSISLDMMTDLMSIAHTSLPHITRPLTPIVMAIPIWLLWHVSLKVRQKLGLVLFLCLNFAMIIVAAIRMSGVQVGGGLTEDIVWAVLWHHVEACIAVVMVSFMTFRSAVVTKNSRTARRQWYAPAASLWNRKNRSARSDDQMESLPNIPSATLTGMNTLIHGKFDTVTDHTDPAITGHLGDDASARSLV